MKMWAYVMLIASISVMLYMFGLTTGNTTGMITLVQQIVDGNGVENMGLYTSLMAIIGVLAIGATITAYTFGNSASAITIANATIALGFLTMFGSDLTFILRKMHDTGVTWTYYLFLIIFAPLIIGYVFAIYNYVVGNDD